MIEPVTSPPRLCLLSKVRVARVFVVDTPEIRRPWPKSWTNWFNDSLVILFFSSFVTTSPRGFLRANDFAVGGLSSMLSLSLCGYKSTTLWLYELPTNSSVTVLSAFMTKRWYTPSWISWR